ncbi:potassium transporter TrkA [Sulfurimonas sp. MAG313]|nr:TrkA C-terminal domain-containing protein [Sulfurimonas sp. MAG313]MDF1881407.1 potassium transporter TrkA [Sulfurimonas sp. MAG313]
MKKILILADGKIGQHFVERVADTYTSDNIYYVVSMDELKIANAKPAQFKFYHFDPTSLYKLSNLLKMEFIQVIIALKTSLDVEESIKNIRTIKKQIRIITLDSWDLSFEDQNIVTVNTKELLSSRLLDFLPNVPVIAQNVGLGEGEIMEVLVPFGSSFVYRHIGAVEQNNWKIVAMYRNQRLILPSPKRMIQPNDLLVLVGEPSVLKTVYRAIKRELGQFPAPYGSNLYLYIDMAMEEESSLPKLIKRSKYIHKNIGDKLYIRIVNPTNIELLEKIKSHRSDDIIIDIDYSAHPHKKIILNDMKEMNIGLVMISSRLFSKAELRQSLYQSKVPVLKLSKKPFSKLKESMVILNDNRDLEKISTTIFDLSSQLSFNLELFNFTQEVSEEKERIIEHYENLSLIFSKSIKIISQEANPIRFLKQKENFLYCLPFTDKILDLPLYSLFSTDTEKLYHRLGEYHQLFIPTQL